ncbi:MAG: hypothetical protein ABSG24_05360 [Acidimicrobiales bacterium]
MPKKDRGDMFARLRPGPKRPAAASREVVMGLDKIERGTSLLAAGLALVLALISAPRLFKNTIITSTATPSKSHTCTKGYHLAKAVCEKLITTHPSYWLPQFLLILVVGFGLAGFAYFRRRVGVIVLSLLLGLALGRVGLIFLIFGGWLIIRAFRLQRYGDATFAGSGAKAREVSKARREAKREGRTYKTPDKTVASLPKPPAESKRYTPKKPPRRKR